jgi:hypothetical protein
MAIEGQIAAPIGNLTSLYQVPAHISAIMFYDKIIGLHLVLFISSVGINFAKGSEFESRWGQEFSFLHVVQTGSGAHPVSYPMGTGGSFPRVKAAVA